MVFVAMKVFSSSSDGIGWQTLLIGLGSLIALLYNAPAPIVLLTSGILGIFLF